ERHHFSHRRSILGVHNAHFPLGHYDARHILSVLYSARPLARDRVFRPNNVVYATIKRSSRATIRPYSQTSKNRMWLWIQRTKHDFMASSCGPSTTRGASAMATYIVFTKESTQDQSEMDIYQSKVGATFKGHPVNILAAYGPQQVLEGEAPEGVVI